jgi:hypothetical protein
MDNSKLNTLDFFKFVFSQPDDRQINNVGFIDCMIGQYVKSLTGLSDDDWKSNFYKNDYHSVCSQLYRQIKYDFTNVPSMYSYLNFMGSFAFHDNYGDAKKELNSIGMYTYENMLDKQEI